MNEMNSEQHAPKSIVECFKELPDPRIDRTRRHKLVDIMVISLCSMLTGGKGFGDMELFGKLKESWLRTFLELPHGIPSHDTFNRVFCTIAPECFLDCFVKWVQGLCPALDGDVVAIDGKALRQALNEGDSIPYIVNAWASDNGLALGQVKVEDKSNEITAIPELLRVLDIKGCVVTTDAMGCQKEIAAQIVKKEADYVLALKGNHGTAHKEVEEFFADAVAPCATQCNEKVLPGSMVFSKRSKKTMEESKPAATGNPTTLSGFWTKNYGRGLKASAWSNPSGVSKAKTPLNGAITSTR
jgi:hypothetical protein